MGLPQGSAKNDGFLSSEPIFVFKTVHVTRARTNYIGRFLGQFINIFKLHKQFLLGFKSRKRATATPYFCSDFNHMSDTRVVWT